jgi:hypothetical protein
MLMCSYYPKRVEKKRVEDIAFHNLEKTDRDRNRIIKAMSSLFLFDDSE